MAGGCRILGRTNAITLVGVLAMTTLLLVLVTTANASALSRDASTLALDPVSGPPVTTVTAVARGFGACPPTGKDDASPGAVIFVWDGDDELDRVGVNAGDGSATTTFVVPESAALQVHRVISRCVGGGGPIASAQFTVTPPVESPVIVPNVIGMTAAEAAKTLEGERLVLGQTTGDGDEVQSQAPDAGLEVPPRTLVDIDLGAAQPDLVIVPNLADSSVDDARTDLASAGLRLGSISGDGEAVQSQSPSAGVEVPRGTAVDITVLPPAPALVTVPDLTGLNSDNVPAILGARGLVLGLVSGQGKVVRSQNPVADSQVKSGSAVNISLDPAVPPPQLVRVPDLVGGSAADARTALAEAGLLLGNTRDDDRGIASQQPAAGTLVPAGSMVTVAYSEPAPWWLAVAVLAVLLSSAVPAHRMLQRRLDQRWVRHHVRAVLETTPPAEGVTESLAGSSQSTSVVRIEPHPDGGTHVLEEV